MAQSTDTQFLAAALAGYQQKLQEIDDRIADIRRRISGGTASARPAKQTRRGRKTGKRRLSPEARERIAAAQRKRWAAARKAAASG